MTGIETKNSRTPSPTEVVFQESLEQLRQQDPRKAEKLWFELQCHFGKPALGHGLSLPALIAQHIEDRVTLGSAGHSYTPESYVAFLFSPDSDNQQVSVAGFMKRFILGEDNK